MRGGFKRPSVERIREVWGASDSVAEVAMRLEVPLAWLRERAKTLRALGVNLKRMKRLGRHLRAGSPAVAKYLSEEFQREEFQRERARELRRAEETAREEM